jgi:hypothetical protein
MLIEFWKKKWEKNYFKSIKKRSNQLQCVVLPNFNYIKLVYIDSSLWRPININRFRLLFERLYINDSSNSCWLQNNIFSLLMSCYFLVLHVSCSVVQAFERSALGFSMSMDIRYVQSGPKWVWPLTPHHQWFKNTNSLSSKVSIIFEKIK